MIASPQLPEEENPTVPKNHEHDVPIVGKGELREWVKALLKGESKYTEGDFVDLKDGTIILEIFKYIWPNQMLRRIKRISFNPQFEDEVKKNWNIVEAVLNEVGVPPNLVDRQGIEMGRFRASFQALTLMFFLHTLVTKHECAFAIAHAVDNKLAQFMSSEAPLNCLIRAGSVVLPSESSAVSKREGNYSNNTTKVVQLCNNERSSLSKPNLFGENELQSANDDAYLIHKDFAAKPSKQDPSFTLNRKLYSEKLMPEAISECGPRLSNLYSGREVDKINEIANANDPIPTGTLKTKEGLEPQMGRQAFISELRAPSFVSQEYFEHKAAGTAPKYEDEEDPNGEGQLHAAKLKRNFYSNVFSQALPKIIPSSMSESVYDSAEPSKIDYNRKMMPGTEETMVMQSVGYGGTGSRQPVLRSSSKMETKASQTSSTVINISEALSCYVDEIGNTNELVEWEGDVPKMKGEKLIQALKLQNSCLSSQLSMKEKVESVIRSQVAKELREMENVYGLKLAQAEERLKVAELKSRESALANERTILNASAEKLRQLEEDVAMTLDISTIKTEDGSEDNGTNMRCTHEGNEGKITFASNKTSQEKSAFSLAAFRNLLKISEEKLRLKCEEIELLEAQKKLSDEELNRIETESENKWNYFQRLQELRESLKKFMPCLQDFSKNLTAKGALPIQASMIFQIKDTARTQLITLLESFHQPGESITVHSDLLENLLLNTLLDYVTWVKLLEMQLSQLQIAETAKEMRGKQNSGKTIYNIPFDRENSFSSEAAFPKLNAAATIAELDSQLQVERDLSKLRSENAHLTRVNNFLKTKLRQNEVFDKENLRKMFDFRELKLGYPYAEEAATTQNDTEVNAGETKHKNTHGSLKNFEKSFDNEKCFCWRKLSNCGNSYKFWLPKLPEKYSQDAVQRDALLLENLQTLAFLGASMLEFQGQAEFEVAPKCISDVKKGEGTWEIYRSSKRKESKCKGGIIDMEQAEKFAATFRQVVQLFWSLQEDTRRYRDGLEVCRGEILRLQGALNSILLSTLENEQKWRKISRTMQGNHENELLSQRHQWRKMIGKTQVELKVCRLKLAHTIQEGELQEKHTTKTLQLCFEADSRRFQDLLLAFREIDTENKLLLATQEFLSELCKYLAIQLQSPSPLNAERIENAWMALLGTCEYESKLCSMNLDTMLSSDNTVLGFANQGKKKLSEPDPQSLSVKDQPGNLVSLEEDKKVLVGSSPENLNTSEVVSNRETTPSSSSAKVTKRSTGSPECSNSTNSTPLKECLNHIAAGIITPSSSSGKYIDLTAPNDEYLYPTATTLDVNSLEREFGSSYSNLNDDKNGYMIESESMQHSKTSVHWISLAKLLSSRAVSSLKLQLVHKSEQINKLNDDLRKNDAEYKNQLNEIVELSCLNEKLTERLSFITSQLKAEKSTVSKLQSSMASMRSSFKHSEELSNMAYVDLKARMKELETRLALHEAYSIFKASEFTHCPKFGKSEDHNLNQAMLPSVQNREFEGGSKTSAFLSSCGPFCDVAPGLAKRNESGVTQNMVASAIEEYQNQESFIAEFLNVCHISEQRSASDT